MSYENIVPKTKDHLDNFARNGYRTLCFSMREINKNEYENFKKEYSSLKTRFLSDKTLENDLENLISTIEKNMILQGATSLEDKLQKGVKKTIQDFIDAGIHVWMLTGDKMDTAQSIAYSCKLFNDDTDVFKIRKCDDDEILKKNLEDINISMSDIENNDDKGENKLNLVKKEMKYIPHLKKMESAPAQYGNDIQKEFQPQSKEDIIKLKNALSKNIDEDKIINNDNLILDNNLIQDSGKLKLKPIEKKTLYQIQIMKLIII
jgi:magnesium-transporting ATPase (P-type)